MGIDEVGIDKVGSWKSGNVSYASTWEHVVGRWAVFSCNACGVSLSRMETAVNMPSFQSFKSSFYCSRVQRFGSNTRRDWLLTDILLVLHTTYVASYNNFHLYSIAIWMCNHPSNSCKHINQSISLQCILSSVTLSIPTMSTSHFSDSHLVVLTKWELTKWDWQSELIKWENTLPCLY